MEYKLQHTVISLVQGDITLQALDAIANAANKELRGGGGVDGAIHQAAGPQLMAACRAIGGCPTGSAVITPGFKLPSRYVIHTVGPIYANRPEDAVLLASCYKSSLALAMEHSLRKIAFPSISTGVYGYPLHLAAPLALGAIGDFVNSHSEAFDLVRMVLFDKKALDAYTAAAKKIVEVIS